MFAYEQTACQTTAQSPTGDVVFAREVLGRGLIAGV